MNDLLAADEVAARKETVVSAIANYGIIKSWEDILHTFQQVPALNRHIEGYEGDDLLTAIEMHILDYVEIVTGRQLLQRVFDANKYAADILATFKSYRDAAIKPSERSAYGLAAILFEAYLNKDGTTIDATLTGLKEHDEADVAAAKKEEQHIIDNSVSGLNKMHTVEVDEAATKSARSDSDLMYVLHREGFIVPREQAVQDLYVLDAGYTEQAEALLNQGYPENEVIVTLLPAYKEIANSMATELMEPPRTGEALRMCLQAWITKEKLSTSALSYRSNQRVSSILREFGGPHEQDWYLACTLPDYIYYMRYLQYLPESARYDKANEAVLSTDDAAVMHAKIEKKVQHFKLSANYAEVLSTLTRWGRVASDDPMKVWKYLDTYIGTGGHTSLYLEGNVESAHTTYDLDVETIERYLKATGRTSPTLEEIVDKAQERNKYVAIHKVAQSLRKYIN